MDQARIRVENARATYFETQSELLAQAASRADYLQRQLQRQQELARTGVVSATKLEEAQNTRRGADRVTSSEAGCRAC